jgi:hypothetical protein
MDFFSNTDLPCRMSHCHTESCTRFKACEMHGFLLKLQLQVYYYQGCLAYLMVKFSFSLAWERSKVGITSCFLFFSVPYVSPCFLAVLSLLS